MQLGFGWLLLLGGWQALNKGQQPWMRPAKAYKLGASTQFAQSAGAKPAVSAFVAVTAPNPPSGPCAEGAHHRPGRCCGVRGGSSVQVGLLLQLAAYLLECDVSQRDTSAQPC